MLLWPTFTSVACGATVPTAIYLSAFEFNSDNNIFQLLSTIHTGACYQSIPTIYGLYFATNGNAVGFIPWASPSENFSTGTATGMLFDGVPYIVQNFGNNTVASIASLFSKHQQRGKGHESSFGNKPSRTTQGGGALLVAVIPSSILSDSEFYHDNGYIGPEALSDIYMHDPTHAPAKPRCGSTNLFKGRHTLW